MTLTTPSGAVVHTVTRHGYSRISDGGPELYPSFYSAFHDFQFVAPIALHWRSESNWEYSFQGVATFTTDVTGRIGIAEPGVITLLALAGGVLAAARGWRLRRRR